MPKDFVYYVTVFAPPNERIQTIARDQFGVPLRNEKGDTYHHVISYEQWLKEEAARLLRQINQLTGIERRREDGQIALYARKT